MGNFVDCKTLASSIKAEVKDFIKDQPGKYGLAIIQTGNDPASSVYIRGKIRDCDECGIIPMHFHYGKIDSYELISKIISLNHDPMIKGIMIQLPVIESLKSDIGRIIDTIAPEKDVDGLTTWNAGALFGGAHKPCHIPCTAGGIMKLLETHGTDLEGKNVCIIGRSAIVGKPLAMLMTNANATVTLCHHSTNDLYDEINRADIIVAAAGCPNLIDGNNPEINIDDKILIDVGINRMYDGKLVGDINANCVTHAKYQTPVPGGIGLLTRAMLMHEVMQTIKLG